MTWFRFWFIHFHINGLNVDHIIANLAPAIRAKQIKYMRTNRLFTEHCLVARLLLGIQMIRVVGQLVPSKHEDLHLKNVLCVEGFKFWIFRCADFLGNEVISTEIESKTNNTDAELVQRPITGTNSIKKCNHRLLLNAIPKI